MQTGLVVEVGSGKVCALGAWHTLVLTRYSINLFLPHLHFSPAIRPSDCKLCEDASCMFFAVAH
jgi:hypothetical protein